MIEQAIKGNVEQFSFANEKPEFIVLDMKKEIKEKEIPIEISGKTLKIGNTHEKLKENHKWKVYVKCDQNVIKKVKFYLHSTFSPSEITVEKAPFELERSGWGTFQIKADVTFTDGKEVTLKHDLSFDQDVKENEIILK